MHAESDDDDEEDAGINDEETRFKASKVDDFISEEGVKIESGK